MVSEWRQELAIASRGRLGKRVESGKPGERETYNPEVALVGLGHSDQASVYFRAKLASEAKLAAAFSAGVWDLLVILV